MKLRPENRLLVQAARMSSPPSLGIPSGQPNAVGFDTGYFLSEVARHNVAGLVYRSLADSDSRESPELRSLMDPLRKMAYAGAARSIFLTSELVRLYSRMDASGIRVIPYKGPVLAVTSYGDLGLRNFYDLDLLVREDQIGPATEFLQDEGYELASPSPRENLASYMTREKEFSFRHREMPVSVELHWRLARKHLSFDLDLDAMFESAQRVTIGSVEMRSMSRSDHILVLCANGCKDRWRRLSLVCDVAETLRTCSHSDLVSALEKAEAVGARRMLLLGLYLATHLLEAPVSRTVSGLVENDRTVRRLAKTVYRWLWDSTGVSGHHGMQKAAFDVSVRERMRDRIPYVRHIAREALVPTVRDQQSLGPFGSVRPLAYLARPLRLARGALAGSYAERRSRG